MQCLSTAQMQQYSDWLACLVQGSFIGQKSHLFKSLDLLIFSDKRLTKVTIPVNRFLTKVT